MKPQSFTLIELLVVIAIIGMLGSFALVAFGPVGEKGRISQAKNFYGQISPALGAEAVGVWRFEEGQGNTVRDSSWNGNDGTIIEGGTWQTSCDLGLGGCMQIGGGLNDYIAAPTDFVASGPFTAVAWFRQIADTGSNPVVFSLADTPGSSRVFILEANGDTVNKAHFRFFSGSNVYSARGTTTLENGTWYFLVGVYDGKKGKIYVDGKLEGTSRDIEEGPTDLNNTRRFVIGGGVTGYESANGYVDEVAFYNEALLAKDIQRLYARALLLRGLAHKKE